MDGAAQRAHSRDCIVCQSGSALPVHPLSVGGRQISTMFLMHQAPARLTMSCRFSCSDDSLMHRLSCHRGRQRTLTACSWSKFIAGKIVSCPWKGCDAICYYRLKVYSRDNRYIVSGPQVAYSLFAQCQIILWVDQNSAYFSEYEFCHCTSTFAILKTDSALEQKYWCMG